MWTNISEKHTVFILRADDSTFLKSAGNYLQVHSVRIKYIPVMYAVWEVACCITRKLKNVMLDVHFMGNNL
jgi:hypothetical protein